jgi:YHS domain-containing protein
MKKTLKTAAIAAVFVAAFALSACGQAEKAADEAAKAASAAAEHAADAAGHAAEHVPALDEAAMKAVLTYADNADGAEDGVVSKCIGCALSMDGKTDHTVEHHGYEFHLCSDHCQEAFEKDPAAVIAKIELPSEEMAE